MEKIKEELIKQLMEQRKVFSDALIKIDFNNMNAISEQTTYSKEIEVIDARIDKILL